tara:strand:- start:908 stop:1558 length:651 start_codon:yes stop_codon:yes gene_type:complete
MMELFYDKSCIEAGIDEAGRGSLIGRVYAAVVIWGDEPLSTFSDELDEMGVYKLKSWDSKKLSENKREALDGFIKRNAMEWAIGYADNEEIDIHNILSATMLAMHRALDQMHLPIDHILVDGNRFKPYIDSDDNWIPFTCVPHGDDTYLTIGSASILAKVAHDNHIKDLCSNNQQLDTRYGLLSNMGYGTKKHMIGIKEYGVSEFHRNTFKCCKDT